MSKQIEKINAFVDSIVNDQLNERQQSLLLSYGPEGEIGGKPDNKDHCENLSCPNLSNGGSCKNTGNCKHGSNKGSCENTGSGGCLVLPANQTITCGGIISNLCTGTNPCTVVGPPIATNRCS